ncbi:MAG: hypothetical protein ABL986_02570 [Vicinamibacterales bacterium]
MFHIDTNRINAPRMLPAMNQLQKWHDDGVIHMYLSETVRDETKAGGNAQRAQKASEFIFSMDYANTADEASVMREIEKVRSGDIGNKLFRRHG